jgi:hypothetical protein
MREIETIQCSCGDKPDEVETTDAEEKEHGCGTRGCCVGAYECPKCKTRWTFAFAAPEV